MTPEQMYLTLFERSKKLASIMVKSGKAMFDEHLSFLDNAIVQIEKEPNKALILHGDQRNTSDQISESNANGEDEKPRFSEMSSSVVGEKLNISICKEEVVDMDNDSDEFQIVPVKNPKGRPKTRERQNKKFNNEPTKAQTVNTSLLTEDLLSRIFLSDVNLVKHSSLWLTGSIIKCFLDVFVSNLGLDCFVFDPKFCDEIEKFSCNFIENVSS